MEVPMHMLGQGVYGTSLYLPSLFYYESKIALQKISLFMKKEKKNRGTGHLE